MSFKSDLKSNIVYLVLVLFFLPFSRRIIIIICTWERNKNATTAQNAQAMDCNLKCFYLAVNGGFNVKIYLVVLRFLTHLAGKRENEKAAQKKKREKERNWCNAMCKNFAIISAD